MKYLGLSFLLCFLLATSTAQTARPQKPLVILSRTTSELRGAPSRQCIAVYENGRFHREMVEETANTKPRWRSADGSVSPGEVTALRQLLKSDALTSYWNQPMYMPRGMPFTASQIVTFIFNDATTEKRIEYFLGYGVQSHLEPTNYTVDVRRKATEPLLKWFHANTEKSSFGAWSGSAGMCPAIYR